MTRGPPRRVAILGCNGYLGSRLVDRLLAQPEFWFVLGVGRQGACRAQLASGRFRYLEGDLTELDLELAFVEHRIESMVYCAFISRPLRSERQAYRDNVLAASKAFAAARASGVGHAVLLSSVAVYGPGMDDCFATERDAARPNDFVFSRHKVLQEHVAWQQLAGGHTALSVLRPCTVVGPRARNFLLDFFRRGPVPCPLRGDPRWQFLHEADFCDITSTILHSRAAGIFNLAPDDTVSLQEVARAFHTFPVRVPLALVRPAVALGWWLRSPLVPAPVEALPFLLHPPLVSNDHVKTQVGCHFRHTSREALNALQVGAGPTDPTTAGSSTAFPLNAESRGNNDARRFKC